MNDEIRKARVMLLAAYLSDAMAQQGMTQAKLARLMDTDRATVCRLLQGHDALASTWLTAFACLDIRISVVKDVAA